MSFHEFEQLASHEPNFKQFLLAGPDFAALSIEREPEPPRDVEL